MSTEPELIPLKLLLGNPRRTRPRLSPDGRHLAFIAPDARDVLQVWLRPVDGDTADRMLTRDPRQGIRNHLWAENGEQVLFLQDREGDENWHVHSVDLEGKLIRDLTPFQGARADGVLLNPKFPNRILVGLNLRSAQLFDLYNVDLRTGAVELHTENPGDVVRWKTDSEFRVRGAVALTPDGGAEVRVRQDEASPWTVAVHWESEDTEGGLLGFTPDDAGLWLSSSSGSDTQRLTRLDLSSLRETVVAEDPRSDLLEAFIHPLTQVAQAAAFGFDKLKWQVLDPTVRRDFELIEALHPGEPNVASRDRDDKLWVLQYSADMDPVLYYLLDRKRQEARLLWSVFPELQRYELAPMRPVVITARDGLQLPSYLTLPSGSQGKELPFVLLVHGGPQARDGWGYSPEVQWLANRGYGVLQVNFRGSTGFGKRFLHAGDREWAGKMHDDLVDAVEWAVREGHADPGRIAIFGGSYGGYAALVGATFTPELFACAVDIVGPSSLVTLIESIPPYWEPARRLLESRIGNPQTEREFLDSRSPLFKADRIRIPMLIAQGANDPRVKRAESEQIVAAVRAAGKQVEYMVFEDEGHGFARPENRMLFYRAAERFLAQHLGGRCEAEAEAGR